MEKNPILTEKRLDLFWKKVEKSKKSGCWEWNASLPPSGRPQFWNGFQLMKARDFGAMIENLPITKGRGHHKPVCGKNHCVNPHHWERGRSERRLPPFDALVKKMGRGKCWIWMGTIAGGYGSYGGKMAHRVSYEKHHGKIAEGKILRHACNVRFCVNPSHLVPGTFEENAKDVRKENLRRARYS